MAGVVIELSDGEVASALAELRRRLVDTGPLLAELGEIVLGQAQESFRAQAAPDGTPWEPSQRAQAQGGQTLVDSGQLLASLTSDVLPGFVEVGTAKLYAAIHQFGGRAGRGRRVRLPARPFLPDESTVDLTEISRAIDDYFAKAAG